LSPDGAAAGYELRPVFRPGSDLVARGSADIAAVPSKIPERNTQSDGTDKVNTHNPRPISKPRSPAEAGRPQGRAEVRVARSPL